MRLPTSRLQPLFDALPAEFSLTVCDVGSIGGLHYRWDLLGERLRVIGFDPLDAAPSTDRKRIFPTLVGDHEGEAQLYVTRRGSMSSTLKPNEKFFAPFWRKPADIEIVREFTAPMARLDRLLSEAQLRPDALKIDVQGGEAAVLSGAVETLRDSILLAEIECSFDVRYEGQQRFDQVVSFMVDHGFILLDVRRLKRYFHQNRFGIDDLSIGKGRAGRLAFCDAVFMLSPDRLADRMAESAEVGLKAMVLAMTYAKMDLASSLFEKIEERLDPAVRTALSDAFSALTVKRGRLSRWLDALEIKRERE